MFILKQLFQDIVFGIQYGKFHRETKRWKDQTFPSRTPRSIAVHLNKEAKELLTAVENGHCKEHIAQELADIWFLMTDCADVQNIDILEFAREKFYDDLLHRQWHKPDKDGVVYHVKGEKNESNAT